MHIQHTIFSIICESGPNENSNLNLRIQKSPSRNMIRQTLLSQTQPKTPFHILQHGSSWSPENFYSSKLKFLHHV